MLAYDAALSESVEFDGPFSSTWVYASGVWSNITATIAPPARAYGCLAYDSSGGEVVLFGGVAPGGRSLNDTWAFDGGIWKNVSSTSGPSPRYAAACADDPHDGGTLLYGGLVNVTGAPFANDTWAFEGSSGWHRLAETYHPPHLAAAGMAYNPGVGTDLLFGGVAQIGSTVGFSSQEWAYNSGGWGNATVLGGPSAREFPAMAYDPVSGGFLVFGGQGPGNSSAAYLNDTWYRGTASWTQFTAPGAAPAPRVSAGFDWDGAAAKALLVGGLYGNTSTPRQLRVDSWAYGGSGWSELSASPNPGARFAEASTSGGGSAASDHLFGGYISSSTALNDTWTFDGGAWQSARGSTAPVGVGFAALAPDATPGEYVLFGGRNASGGASNQTWTFAGSWTNRTTSSAPAARFGAVLVFDPATASDVLFGGITSLNVTLNDTWRYAAGAWTRLSPVRSPPARAFASAVWDAADSGMLLFGGSASGTALGPADDNDTWLFSGGNWTKLAPSAAPVGRIGAAITFDERRNSPVLFGGWSTAGTGSVFNDTWALPGGLASPWVQIPAHAAPAPGGFGAGWWDGSSNATWLFGGAAVNRSTLALTVSAKSYALDLLTTTVNVSGTGGPTPYTVNFSALSDHGEAPYRDAWTLAGQSESGPAGSFTLDTAGTYALVLNVTDAWGVIERLSFLISTIPGPLRASFTASALNGTAPLNVQFHATAGGGSPPFVYQWNFGDGSAPVSGPSANASHEFVHNATFTVVLTVTGTSGPNGTSVQTISLHSLAPFDVSAQLTPTSGVFPLNVSFSATTRNGTAPFHFVWSFGDGEGSTRASGSHEFVSAGNYTVRLNATDTNGSVVQRAFQVRVSNPPSGPPTASGGTSSGPPWWVWAVVAVIVVLAIVGVVALRRRSRPPGTAPTGSAAPSDGPGRRALPPARPPAWDEGEE